MQGTGALRSAAVDQPAAPGALRAVSGLVLLEGAALTALGIWFGVRDLTDETYNLRDAIIAAVLTVLAGLALLLLGRALGASRSWARSPVVVCQLLAVPVGLSMLGAGRPEVGVPVLGLAAAVLVLLFTPAVRAELDRT